MKSQAGFSLLEAVATLAIVSMILVGAMGMIDRAPRVIARTEARQTMLAEAERALESVRAGTIKLASGRVRLAGSDSRLSLRLEVRPTAVNDLYELTVQARFELGGEVLEERLASKIWRRR